MYGIIGQIKATPDTRDALIAILRENETGMAGCHLYHIAKDVNDAAAIWITESWDDAAMHKASLQLPQVQAAIARARPLITGFGPRYETEPVTPHKTA